MRTVGFEFIEGSCGAGWLSQIVRILTAGQDGWLQESLVEVAQYTDNSLASKIRGRKESEYPVMTVMENDGVLKVLVVGGLKLFKGVAQGVEGGLWCL